MPPRGATSKPSSPDVLPDTDEPNVIAASRATPWKKPPAPAKPPSGPSNESGTSNRLVAATQHAANSTRKVGPAMVAVWRQSSRSMRSTNVAVVVDSGWVGAVVSGAAVGADRGSA